MMKKYILCICCIAFLCSACKNENKNGDNKIDKCVDEVGDSILEADTLNDETNDNEDFQSPEAMKQSSKNVSARGETGNVVVNQKFEVEKDGVGEVKVGMNVKDLPQSIDGLYNKIRFESNGSSGKVCMLYDGNNSIMEIDFNNKTNLIRFIRITSQSIKSIHGVYQFMDVKNLVRIPKVKQALDNKNIDDVFEINVEGIVYEIEENVKGNKYVSAIVVGK